MPELLLIREYRCFLFTPFCTDQQLPRTREDPVLSIREKSPYSSVSPKFPVYSPSEGYVDGSEPKEVFSLKELR